MKTILLFACLWSVGFVFAQEYDWQALPNKNMRVDYWHCGNSKTDSITWGSLYIELCGIGNDSLVLPEVAYGSYKFEVRDSVTNQLFWQDGYSTLFYEYQTTPESMEQQKCFEESIRFPFFSGAVKVELFKRKGDSAWQSISTHYVNSKNAVVKKQDDAIKTVLIHGAGNSAETVDIVMLPDGYTQDEMDQFKSDAQKMATSLFLVEPFKSYSSQFNIWLVMAPSEESGITNPNENTNKNTLLKTSFNCLNMDRYLMTEKYHTVLDIASYVPYDQIVILSNTSKYGGGAIYNYYSCFSTGNGYSTTVFVHEFGHSFGGLGDEYYTSAVSYQNIYPLNEEMWQPNLTTLVHFEKKWKNLMDKKTPVPTPDKKKYASKLGVFEGGGYSATGIYRPAKDCKMKSNSSATFCKVCYNVLENQIKRYSHSK